MKGWSLVPPVDNAGWNQEGRRIESQQHYWQHWPVPVPVLLLLLCQETRKSVRTKERWALYLYQYSRRFGRRHSTTSNESTMKLMNWRELPTVSIIHYHIQQSPAPTILTRLFFKRGIQR